MLVIKDVQIPLTRCLHLLEKAPFVCGLGSQRGCDGGCSPGRKQQLLSRREKHPDAGDFLPLVALPNCPMALQTATMRAPAKQSPRGVAGELARGGKAKRGARSLNSRLLERANSATRGSLGRIGDCSSRHTLLRPDGRECFQWSYRGCLVLAEPGSILR